jgi:hypothetical protein
MRIGMLRERVRNYIIIEVKLFLKINIQFRGASTLSIYTMRGLTFTENISWCMMTETLTQKPETKAD